MWVLFNESLNRNYFCIFLGDPNSNEKATADPYKTLFIARLVRTFDL